MSDSEVLIGGERMVALRGAALIPAELEVTATAGDRYRRASEFLAQLTEEGRAPWMIARDPRYALPDSIESRHWTGPNAVSLAAAADSRGYSDPRWGSEEEIAREGGRVRAGEQEAGALYWRFAGRDRATGETCPSTNSSRPGSGEQSARRSRQFPPPGLWEGQP